MIACSACREEVSSERRPSAPAARPSAMVFGRVSIARNMCGQMNFAVMKMKTVKLIACAMSVRFRFIPRAPGVALLEGSRQRIGEGEEHGDAQTDDERRVDQ